MNLITGETDILVIGASASGTCAAVQAARMGHRVMLCEPTRWVGGMLTAAGVSATDGNNLLPSGLWGEFQRAIRNRYGGPEAVETGWVSNTLFDPRAGLAIFRRRLSEFPSIHQKLGWSCIGVDRFSDQVTGAVFETRDGEAIRIRARITIMADEFGDAVAMAGIPWRTGLEARSQSGEPEAPATALPHPQDLTWAAVIGVPPPGFAAEHRGPVFPAGSEFHGILGDPPITWDRFFDYGRLPGGLAMLNWPGQDFYGDYLDIFERPEIFRRAKEKTRRLIQALRDAFGQRVITLPRVFPAGSLAVIPYIREARRIYGIETLTTRDLTDPAASPVSGHGIAVGDYPLDHHRRNDPEAPSIAFPKIAPFSVPYGALVPEGFGGVIVAEKSIGVTGLVNGCTRLQPVVTQIGQAAGAAAALCVEGDIEPGEVDVRRLQSVLQDSGVYLVPATDAPPEAHDFEALHWAGAAGILPLRTVSEGWANRGYLDPDLPVTGEILDAARRMYGSLPPFPAPVPSRRDFARILHARYAEDFRR